MRQPKPARSATVLDEEGGTVIIDTFDLDNKDQQPLQLVFRRSINGWELEVKRLSASLLRMPITYTQANILGFMMRAARGDDD